MPNDLDQMLAQLAQDAPAGSLEGLETAVMRGIAKRREELRASRAIVPARAASVVMALALGVAAGGMAAAKSAGEPHRLNTFSAGAHLAPSTLLEGME
jgi:hypothetical protein